MVSKKMLKSLLILLVTIITSISAIRSSTESIESNTLEIVWEKTFGGSLDDKGGSPIQSSDSGFVITGLTKSYGSDNYDVWIIKTDSNGDHEWNTTFGGSDLDEGLSIQKTSSGDFIIAGNTDSFGVGDTDYLLVKVDSNGNILWNKTYGGVARDVFRSLLILSDGSLLLAGGTDSFGSGGDQNVWMIKVDENGNHIWNRTFGTGRALSVIQTSDGDFAFGGYQLFKINNNGSQEWNVSVSSAPKGTEFFNSIIQTSDGGYAFAGGSKFNGNEDSFDFVLRKTSSSGQIAWTQMYGGIKWENSCCERNVIQTEDGGYILVGETRSFGAGNTDGWIVKTDANGNKEWDKMLGGPSDDHIDNIYKTSDGNLILTGYTESKGNGFYDLWLIKANFASSNSEPSGLSPGLEIVSVLLGGVTISLFVNKRKKN
ncbi:MAG: hypothetical protein ACW967_07995 [Candidatus Hodarchaeales archaeon]